MALNGTPPCDETLFLEGQPAGGRRAQADLHSGIMGIALCFYAI